MSSFLEKLNKRGVANTGSDRTASLPQASGGSAPGEGALQLDADVQQSLTEIVICAPLAGVDAADLRVTIEGENDIVVIQGERKKPGILTAKGEGSMKAGESAMFLQRECQWGQFFRKVFLPAEIEPSRAQVTLSKGLLTIVLPLKVEVPGAGNGIALQVAEVP